MSNRRKSDRVLVQVVADQRESGQQDPGGRWLPRAHRQGVQGDVSCRKCEEVNRHKSRRKRKISPHRRILKFRRGPRPALIFFFSLRERHNKSWITPKTGPHHPTKVQDSVMVVVVVVCCFRGMDVLCDIFMVYLSDGRGLIERGVVHVTLSATLSVILITFIDRLTDMTAFFFFHVENGMVSFCFVLRSTKYRFFRVCYFILFCFALSS